MAAPHVWDTCRWCRSGRENLCCASQYTGWDADGGYAESTTVPEGFAYRFPEEFDDATVTPLLCAGIIGYRALRRAQVPPGGRPGTARVQRLCPPDGASGHGGDIVPFALEALAPGRTLALAGIHVSDYPPLNDQRHVFHERTTTSVERNTRRDGEEFLVLAARLAICPQTTSYAFEEADRALAYLAAGDVRGAGVLRVSDRG